MARFIIVSVCVCVYVYVLHERFQDSHFIATKRIRKSYPMFYL